MIGLKFDCFDLLLHLTRYFELVENIQLIQILLEKTLKI